MAIPVYVRKAHRILATLWLVFAVVALAVTATGTEVPTAVGTTVGILLLVLAISGLYMLVRPWVQRFRAR